MMETRLLTLYCKKCKARTKPFGDSLKIVPYSANVICPECGNEEWVDWLDTETLKKVLQNKYAKSEKKNYDDSIKILESKMQVLEIGRDADRAEIQNLRQLIDLAIQKDIKELKENVSKQDYDKNFLQGQITKIQEDFEQLKKWKKSQDG